MDCNSIIYDALKKEGISGEKKIVEYVITKIKYYIQFIQPSETVYIAFDGVAPFAKMDQQRTRRYKSAFMASIDFENGTKLSDEELEKKIMEDAEEHKFNSCAITPGTSFMEYLAREIEYAFLHVESSYGDGKGKVFLYKKLKIITSTSKECGEGEHKMFEYMRENVKENEVVAVYGLDADLIMLSIFHTLMCKNIYIFREAPEFSQKILPTALRNGGSGVDHGLDRGNGGNIKMHDSSATTTTTTATTDYPIFIDTIQFIKSILKEMGCRTFDAARIYDYIFMCFMLGNDFLPHFPAINIRTNGINHLMDVYQRIMGKHNGKYFISLKSGKIQWKWVAAFVKELANNEYHYILREYDSKEKLATRVSAESRTAKEREALFDNTPVLCRADEIYICPEEESGWRSRYYKMAFGEEVSDGFLKKVCVNYLEGLEWVFKYYTEGCPHWRWKYHYSYPPLLVDLVKYIPMFETDFLKSVLLENKPFSANTQLVYVLPRAYHFLLPKKVQEKVNCYMNERGGSSSGIGIGSSSCINSGYKESSHLNYFPRMSELKFKWMFCRYFWECHIDLPEINMEYLEFLNNEDGNGGGGKSDGSRISTRIENVEGKRAYEEKRQRGKK
jgi:5'-3' exonuclease